MQIKKVTFFLVLIPLICLLAISDAKKKKKKNEVCFKDLGCFSEDPPWVDKNNRPLPPPQGPDVIQPTAMFYSRKEKAGQKFDIFPNVTFKWKDYKSGSRTVYIIHGYGSSGKEQWVTDLKNAYLKARDSNIFIINWNEGASRDVTYGQALANCRVVGRIVGNMVTTIIKTYKNSVRNTHLIGDNVGAHCAAYAAVGINKRSKAGKIDRLTGLDPEQPFFQNLSTEVRLDKSKAKFVEVIHSDAKKFPSGLGYLTREGTVDFYLNQGFNQPGCATEDKPLQNAITINELKDKLATEVAGVNNCSRWRARQVFTASLHNSKNCKFEGHRLITDMPVTSNQNDCGKNKENCATMGIDIQKKKGLKGAFQVFTSSKWPFCCGKYSPATGCSNDHLKTKPPKTKKPKVTPTTKKPTMKTKTPKPKIPATTAKPNPPMATTRNPMTTSSNNVATPSNNPSAATTGAPAVTTKSPGAPTGAPGATTGSPGAPTGAPGATTGAPGATTGAPGAPTGAPGATQAIPGATTGVPGAPTGAPVGLTITVSAATPTIAATVPSVG